MSGRPKPTVIFVPGALTGGWIWARDFAPFFAAAGYGTETVTFPSHEAGGLRRQQYGLASAVAHLRGVVARQSIPPVVIAHSLGGLVTLLLAREQPLAAAALLSPVPSDGVWRSLVSLARRSPSSLAKLLSVAVDARVTRFGTPPVGIYSESCDPTWADAITKRLRGESLRALGEALWRRDTGGPLTTPLRFFGAEGDYIIPASEVRRMAARYRAPVTIYPGMSHTFQAERGWQRVATDVRDWLDTIPV